MQDEVLKAGWQQLHSDGNQDYLYKLYAVKGLAAGLTLVTAAVKTVSALGINDSTHLSMDGHAVTVSLNSPAAGALNAKHFEAATQIDMAAAS